MIELGADMRPNGDIPREVVTAADGPRADRLVWTEVHETVEGDTRFPDVDWDKWREVEREDREDISFVVYDRA